MRHSRLMADGNQKCWDLRTALFQMSVFLLLQLSAFLSWSDPAEDPRQQRLLTDPRKGLSIFFLVLNEVPL